MDKKKVAILVGSLRKGSFNRKMAMNMIQLAPQDLDLQIVEIGQLPLYNQDFDKSPPAEWIQFRDQIRTFDAILFVSPEYNRSVPAVLKNAIDVGSRPYGQSVWDSRPAAVVTVSVGDIGGFGANHHLRQMLFFLNMPALQQPEAYIGQGAGLFDEADAIKKQELRDYMSTFLQKFSDFIQKNQATPSMDPGKMKVTKIESPTQSPPQ